MKSVICVSALVAFVEGSFSSVDSRDLNKAVSRVFKTRLAFAKDRSVVSLMKSYESSPRLAKFFSEVESAIAENPSLLTVADVPQSASDADKGYGSSALPAEIAVAVVKLWNAPVTFKGESDVPLHRCLTKSVRFRDVEDFKSLIMYASLFDKSDNVGADTLAIRREWIESLANPAAEAVLGNLTPALMRYRGCSLVMSYESNACGESDPQRAARMNAHNFDSLLKKHLPKLRAALGTVESSTGMLVRLTRVQHPNFNGRVAVVVGPQGPNNSGEMSTGVACFVKGAWVTVRVSLSKFDKFEGKHERDFLDLDNKGVTLRKLGDETFALASKPETFLTDKVVEMQARLIGLIVNQHFGFDGLVAIADTRRQYTGFLSRVYNYIGDFQA